MNIMHNKDILSLFQPRISNTHLYLESEIHGTLESLSSFRIPNKFHFQFHLPCYKSFKSKKGARDVTALKTGTLATNKELALPSICVRVCVCVCVCHCVCVSLLLFTCRLHVIVTCVKLLNQHSSKHRIASTGCACVGACHHMLHRQRLISANDIVQMYQTPSM